MVSVDDMDPFDVPILHHKESSSTLLFKHSEMWKRQIYCHNYRINVGPVATEVHLLNDGRNYSVAWPTLGLYPVPLFLYQLYQLFIKQIFFQNYWASKNVVKWENRERKRKQVFDKKEEMCKDDIQLIGGIYNIFFCVYCPSSSHLAGL